MRTRQFYDETVTITSSRKNNKNLACFGKAVRPASGRPGLGISKAVVSSDLTETMMCFSPVFFI
jgi:hypothetical protein